MQTEMTEALPEQSRPVMRFDGIQLVTVTAIKDFKSIKPIGFVLFKSTGRNDKLCFSETFYSIEVDVFILVTDI